jgi:hypothetical protein
MATPLLTNINVNYTNYYNLINFFAEYMAQHPSIASVSTEEIDEFDKREFQAYPVVNVTIPSTRFATSTTNYEMQIIVADKVKNNNNESDSRNNKQTSPYYGVNDLVDISSNTLAIANDITSFIQRGVTSFDINGAISCKQFEERFDNGLAGWVITFTLTTHNDKNRCLFELYPN